MAATGHDGSAEQYPEWASEGHANAALTHLKAVMGPNPPAQCLECHSADYRIVTERASQAHRRYRPSTASPASAATRRTTRARPRALDEEFTPAARGTGRATNDLCVECHNGEIPEGTTAAPGTEIHHPMKEMMDGYGAIDVSAFPSVHKGKCVQCHMPPTTHQPRRRAAGWQPHVQHHRAGRTPTSAPIPSPATAVATTTPSPAARRDHHHVDGRRRHAVLGLQHLPQHRPTAGAVTSTTRRASP